MPLDLVSRVLPFSIESFLDPRKHMLRIEILSLRVGDCDVPSQVYEHETPCSRILPNPRCKGNMLLSTGRPDSSELNCGIIRLSSRWNRKLIRFLCVHATPPTFAHSRPTARRLDQEMMTSSQGRCHHSPSRCLLFGPTGSRLFATLGECRAGTPPVSC